VCDRVVSLVDLYRTLTDLCGIPDKKDVEGRSLTPLLRDPAAPWPHAAITHLDRVGSYAISTERWRYIHYRGGGEELYDVEADGHEWTNLAGKPEQDAKLAEMRALAPKDEAPIREAQAGIDDIKAEAILELIPESKAPCPHSKISSQKVPVVFQNRRDSKVTLVWVDADGKHQERKTMAGATRHLVQTYSGHAWLVLDEKGKPLGHFIIGTEAAQAPIQ
jgi:hypothetical protein